MTCSAQDWEWSGSFSLSYANASDSAHRACSVAAQQLNVDPLAFVCVSCPSVVAVVTVPRVEDLRAP